MKIMVCYNGSRSSREALRLARDHAKAFSGSVIIVTSMTKGTESEKNDIEKAELDLEFEKKACEDEGIACATHLLIRGLSPGEDLVQFAEEEMADEIIIGIKRRSKVEKLVFGSTAQFVILKAHCPVVTVK
ncbi:MAG: universal stress protein [Deltaproteobacteria bacterium]|nr:universal stress protein [Deltaproteobacteria bacterium]MBW2298537.1 universal stress protein [Deltaproteobacteria bacterium]MBW2614371.1 universal stress protein [Deltaproteobacteria bacterium]MBW2679069.1 universal stress protein [Deltaproteobacteria bacterium]